MKIEFISDYAVRDGSGKTYKAGELVNLVDPSAQHFLRRGVAKVYTDLKQSKPAVASRGGTKKSIAD